MTKHMQWKIYRYAKQGKTESQCDAMNLIEKQGYRSQCGKRTNHEWQRA